MRHHIDPLRSASHARVLHHQDGLHYRLAFIVSRDVRLWAGHGAHSRQVYQSITPDTFRSIFSDLLLERDPCIEARLQIRVVDGPVVGYGRRASEDR